MKISDYHFSRLEFAGALGDLGTLIPLSVALIMFNGLSVTPVLLMVGLFYILSGLYFKLPIPVQPLKVVSAIAITDPSHITLPVISAAGIILGSVLILLALTGIIDRLVRFFSKPIVRGIQVGLGLALMQKGIQLMIKPELFIHKATPAFYIGGISVNLLIGIVGFGIALLLLSNKKFPASLVIVGLGGVIGLFSGALIPVVWGLGPTPVKMVMPEFADYLTATLLLVLPQLPLTLGNAVMGTTDTCYSLFGKSHMTRKVSNRAFALSIGIMNTFCGFIGGMPMCHGAGGLAAHYRFGARTGGSNIMIGLIFIFLAVGLGQISITLLTAIPNAILGVLLVFAGIELCLLIKDLKDKGHLFVTFLIAGIGLASSQMGVAFIVGIIVMYVMERFRIEI